ncbi:MAG: CpsB/CapC family capsule biosynthesis tyrosine phosphatase [Bacteroidota bacterium]
MGIFSRLFKRKEELLDPADLSVLHTDIHSHLIPGIDDGAKTLNESIEMIQKFVELGFKKIITTPHVMNDYYRNDKEKIIAGLEGVQGELANRNVQIKMDASAEYYLDDDLERKIESKEVIPIHNKYLLFELPFVSEPIFLNQIVFTIQSNGLIPILAHPERYTYWKNEYSKYKELKDKGVLFQLNINSLSGYYSPEARQIAEWMVDQEMIELVGTDCHRLDHLAILENHTSRMPYCHKLLERDLLNKVL